MLISRRAIMQAGILAPGWALLPSALLAGTERGFTHSVASGDPSQHAVRLWTRYVGQEETPLRLEVSESEEFRSIAANGSATAGPATDYCAQVSVGGLRPGRTYYYRFVAAGGDRSPVGRTRTLPEGGIEHYRIAVVSCANATSGWFNGYAHAAMRDDLDLVVHLGDYIYESPTDRSDALEQLAIDRGILPKGEAVTLFDYRQRYASYRRDPALMELHRRHPIIVIWDDHETANNSWENGAKNHDPVTEGEWSIRKRAGVRAFHEWLPMAGAPYSQYRIGDLATLFRLETRLLARSKQLDISIAIAGRRDLDVAVSEFLTGPLADPARMILGSSQEDWLTRGMAESVDAGISWQVLLQQVIMAPMRLPKVGPDWFAADVQLSADRQREIAIANHLSSLGLPMGLDRWDGYPQARARLLDLAARAKANLVVLSGDSHNAWAYNLVHEERPAGVEMAVQGISSLGLEKRFGGAPATIAADFVAHNPGLKWCDTSRRGYMICDITKGSVAGHWHFMSSRNDRSLDVLETVKLMAYRGSNSLDVS